ncbi:MAG: ABC transporter substrate-binding protein, partial [Burkholderiaceae bacterium]
MSDYYDPYDADRPLQMKCHCGRDHTVAEHVARFGQMPEPVTAARVRSEDEAQEVLATEFVQASLVKALFPQEPLRRAFLKAVGARTAAAAIASVLPVGAMQALAQDKRPLEKTDLKIGFLPITCATPLVAADPLGFYAKEGLKVELNRTAGWAVVRDKTLAGEFDASHM